MQTERVVIISNTLSSTLVFRQTLVEKLHRLGRLAFILSTSNDREFIDDNGDGYQIVVLAGSTLVKKFISFKQTVKRCRKLNVRIFHGFTHLGNLVATLLWFFVGGKLVLNVTGMGRAFSSSGFRYSILRSFILLFYSSVQFFVKNVIVQNQDDKRLLSKVFLSNMQDKICVTNGSGIDLHHFKAVSARDASNDESIIRVGFFSRALPEKGVDAYYQLANFFSGDKNIKFFHWGHFGTGIYSQQQIKQTAIRSNISYLGFEVDPRANILSVDIIVLPSGYREGLSRLCIEAMLAGKVVVARSTAGVRDHLKNGVNAIVYDEPDGLIFAFQSALRANRDVLGKAAHDYANSAFDVEKVDRVYFDAYGLDNA